MKPVKSSDTPSVISTSNPPPKSPTQARTIKTGNLPRLSTRQIKKESDQDKHGDAEAARKVAKLKKLGFE